MKMMTIQGLVAREATVQTTHGIVPEATHKVILEATREVIREVIHEIILVTLEATLEATPEVILSKAAAPAGAEETKRKWFLFNTSINQCVHYYSLCLLEEESVNAITVCFTSQLMYAFLD